MPLYFKKFNECDIISLYNLTPRQTATKYQGKTKGDHKLLPNSKVFQILPYIFMNLRSNFHLFKSITTIWPPIPECLDHKEYIVVYSAYHRNKSEADQLAF